MSMATDVTTRCSRAASEAFRLAADPAGTLKAGSFLLRGTPQLAAWVAAWAATEFPLRVLTGHALTAIPPTPVDRFTNGLADQGAEAVLGTALRDTFGVHYGGAVEHPIAGTSRRPTVAGVWQAARRRRRYASTTTDISYGPGGRDNLLDVWRLPEVQKGRRAPVLLQIPGGAWAISEKRGQAYPLMSRMVELGWVCVSINYSRSPISAWPAHIVDVKRAIAWIRENIAEYGGDPDFIAVTGGSAGGHLGALAALTDADLSLQPGFEHADTAVQAAVPYYGVYDLTSTEHMHRLMMPFLEQFVMKVDRNQDPARYAAASPVTRVHQHAPPFFVLHGTDDAVIPHGQADAFTAALRAAGVETVCSANLPHAHHAFDTVATVRTQLVADAVADFLGIAYSRHRAGRDSVERRAGQAG